jgi:hypothetical protein
MNLSTPDKSAAGLVNPGKLQREVGRILGPHGAGSRMIPTFYSPDFDLSVFSFLDFCVNTRSPIPSFSLNAPFA